MSKQFWDRKKVLITGHEGFLGSWLAGCLLEKGAYVVGIDKSSSRAKSVLKPFRHLMVCLKGDVSNFNLVEKIINRHKPEVVFHLAAEAIVGVANRNPRRAFKSNIEGTWNILEACRGKKFIKNLIVASSDKAYGSHKNLPYTEEMALAGRHPYDVSKSCTDLLSLAYHNTYQVPVSVTRCGNIYGPGDWNLSRLVPDAVRSILKRKKLIIRSDGKFIRDYIYIKDIVRGYMLLAEKMRKLKLYGEAFNFSNEKPITVLELFEKILRISKKKAPAPKILNKAQYEIRCQYLSARKAKTILRWNPVYTLERGLEATIKWYAGNL